MDSRSSGNLMRKSLIPKFQLLDQNIASNIRTYNTTQFLVVENVIKTQGLISLLERSSSHCKVIPIVPMDINTGDNDKPTTMEIIQVMSNQW